MPAPSSSSSSSSLSSSSSWTTSLLTLPTTQQGRLVITSVASVAITAASIFSYQAAIRLQRRRELAKRVDRATRRDRNVQKNDSHSVASTAGGDEDAEGRGEEDGEPVDGGTPRYLEHLAHLSAAKAASPSQAAMRGSPLRRETSYQSNLSSQSIKPTLRPSPSSYDESLIREQLSRNYSFLGEEGMAKLRDAFIIVVGLGGVGSHVALSLIRSGIGYIRLIDFDQVSLSSLNRHAVASLEDVGRPKVTICQEHFSGISPWVHIQAWVDVFNESEAPRLFSPFRLPAALASGGAAKEVPVTYVIDCIDNLSTKVGLLAYCHENGIKVFSSMGAGAKCDPTRICIGDLSATEEDPLAKSVRRRLRERGIPKIDESKATEAAVVEQGSQSKKKNGRAQNTEGGRKSHLEQQGTNKVQRHPSSTSQQYPSTKSRHAGKTNQVPLKPAPTPPPISLPERRSFSNKRLSRASSSSSFGSGEGAFFTPEGTPGEEQWRYTLGDEDGNNDDTDTLTLPEPVVDDMEETDQTIAPLPSPGAADRDALSGRDADPSAPLLRPSNQHRSSSGLQSLSASPMEEKTQRQATAGFSEDKNNEEEDVTEVESEEAEGHRGKGIAANSTSLARPDKERPTKTHQKAERKSAARQEENLQVSSRTKAASTLSPTNPVHQIPCIFSVEKPPAQLLPLPEEEFQKEGGVEMLRALEDGNEWRVRVLPVLGPLPAIFGLSIASWIICDVVGAKGVGGVDLMQPMESRVRKKAFEKIQRELENLERLYPSSAPGASVVTHHNPTIPRPGRGSPFLLNDVLYLVQEVFHSRSIMPPHSTISSHNGLLVRWDSTLPLGYGNVALLTKEEGKIHAIEVLKRGRSPVEVWGEEAAACWRRRMEEERWYARLR